MAPLFRPAAGGSYFRKSENDEPVLVERTGHGDADGWAFGTMPDEAAVDETPVAGLGETDHETEAPKGRRKGR